LPTIWEQFDTFTARARDTEAAAERLAGTINAATDLGPALGELGATCKACHSAYRK
jgi:cytochrome c556